MYITLEAGGSRPPTNAESTQIRLALSCAKILSGVSYTAGDSPITLATDGQVVFVDASAGNVTVRLPTISGATTRSVRFKRVDDSAFTVTILPSTANPGATIDNESSQTLPGLSAAEIVTGSSNWWVISFSLNGALLV